MTNEKDSKALGDDKTVMVHKLMCEYLKAVEKHTGEKIELTIKGLTEWTEEDERKKNANNM